GATIRTGRVAPSRRLETRSGGGGTARSIRRSTPVGLLLLLHCQGRPARRCVLGSCPHPRRMVRLQRGPPGHGETQRGGVPSLAGGVSARVPRSGCHRGRRGNRTHPASADSGRRLVTRGGPAVAGLFGIREPHLLDAKRSPALE